MMFMGRLLCVFVLACSTACAVDHHADDSPDDEGVVDGTQDPAGQSPASGPQSPTDAIEDFTPPADQGEDDVDVPDPGEVECAVTPDCPEEIARTICDTSEDCEVCVQYVDHEGNPVAWLALHNASQCDCLPPQTPSEWCWVAADDFPDAESAQALCDTLEDCGVCVQEVDEAGNPVRWAVAELYSSCGCGALEAVEARR